MGESYTHRAPIGGLNWVTRVLVIPLYFHVQDNMSQLLMSKFIKIDLWCLLQVYILALIHYNYVFVWQSNLPPVESS